MAIIYELDQAGTVDMRVDLRRADVTMAQQGLQCPEICTPFEQMGSKSMPQDMRADICRIDSCPDSMFLDNLI